MSPHEKLKVVVSGMVAATPNQGGATWAVLQYLIGLRRLGHDPFFVEPIDAIDRRVGWCAKVMERHGLAERWCLVAPDGTTAGLTRVELEALGGRTDVLLNVAGMLTCPAILDAAPVRAYLDLDPAFVQLWHSADGVDMRFDAHTHFVTVSDAVGRTIPDCGRDWIPTLPPVVLEEWPVADRLEHHALTTVGHWRSYGSIRHDGVHYGQKAHSFRRLIEVPRRIDLPVIVALGIHPDEFADVQAMAANGWQLVDPRAVAGTPEEYRRFIQRSFAELGVAKSGYVVSDSGWFSDRSACYLASGRPVIAEDTGFSRRLPVGEGIFAFRDVDGVGDALTRLRADYARHRAGARAIAEAHLNSDIVLRTLLDRLMS